MGNEFVLFGTNKIFLRLEAVAKLDKLRAEKLFKKEIAARKFQNAWFRYKQLKRFRLLRSGVRQI